MKPLTNLSEEEDNPIVDDYDTLFPDYNWSNEVLKAMMAQIEQAPAQAV
jgi:hypothetical protein